MPAIRLLLFARAREAAGQRDDTLDLPDGATLGDALAVARDRYPPEFADVLGASRVWINGDEPASGSATPLSDGDEVAVLPPVSGGGDDGGSRYPDKAPNRFPLHRPFPEVSATQRIQRLVDPAYSAALDRRDLAELREMRAECAAVETAVSYTRRLAQGRFEILSAYQGSRQSGGSVHDLVADLPRILGDERGRSSAADARLVEPEEPELDLDWGPRSGLIDDDSLATIDDISDDDLVATLAALQDFERELSEYRHALHRVLDGIDQELGARAVGGVG